MGQVECRPTRKMEVDEVDVAADEGVVLVPACSLHVDPRPYKLGWVGKLGEVCREGSGWIGVGVGVGWVPWYLCSVPPSR